MGAQGSFEERLRRFYDDCSEEEKGVVAYMAASALAVSNLEGAEVQGFTSDLGQQLQLQLQEANNIFARVSKAQSDISAKYAQVHDGIAQNFK